MNPCLAPDLAVHLEAFFAQRLISDLNASPHTIAAYRDTFRLLLGFVEGRLGREPAQLAVADIDSPLVVAFLEHLERERRNAILTRNTRLAAIHSFFRFLALRDPRYSGVVQRVLAIPPKRTGRRLIEFLTEREVLALLAVPDLNTWVGRRDRAMILLAVEGGFRVSELTGLRVEDVVLGKSPHIRCHGKGRKERATPLRRESLRVLRDWIRERGGTTSDPLFPSTRGGPLSRDGVAYFLDRYVAKAASECPTLLRKRITPHVLRHTTAMTLLERGIDRSVIALWLGHESVESTESYLHADLRLKQRALDQTKPRLLKGVRYRPPDRLLAFLESV